MLGSERLSTVLHKCFERGLVGAIFSGMLLSTACAKLARYREIKALIVRLFFAWLLFSGCLATSSLAQANSDSANTGGPITVTPCRKSAGEAVMAELDDSALMLLPHPEKRVNWENETSYSRSCPVMNLEGKHLAVCPF
jgi:hypothetical protein